MQLALFDLDHTLIPADSDHAWGQFLVNRGEVDGHAYAAANDRFYQQYRDGTLDIELYLRFALAPLARIEAGRLLELQQAFMREVIEPLIKPQALDLVRKHQERGDVCLMITATNEFVTAPIAAEFGLPNLIATTLESVGGEFTGQPRGTPSFREGKVVRTEAWLAWYRAQAATGAIGLDASETAPAQRLIKACRELVPQRGGMDKPVRVLICGVPNVGKSTLMNTLVGRKAAKTGDEAGVTRIEQRINLANDFYLFDTPGMLWPKILVEKSGYHLAASGAVGRNAYDETETALELIHSIKGTYAAALAERYKLDDVAAIPATHDDVLLTEIGRKRGAVMSGGRIDLQKAAEIVLNDFRSGTIGRITLETPEAFTTWLAEAKAAEAERQRQKLAMKKAGRHTPRKDPRGL